ncbi:MULTISPECIES: ABC transporter permease [Muribaculum]|jgi:phospholipid/cholesterol/gamma-HCH transport system permease protein|uniref:ABC transporter permease n=4 Tax=Muribaculum TaxID=1918540 RepID=A0AC61S625_9BACT|nr:MULTISPECIES: ABC transporter permease [Muribaculum]THG52119.1 ABC transporter permease [Muribaculum caecicola]
MIIKSSITTFGQYCMFMYRVFSWPTKWRVFGRKFVQEIGKLGLDSIPLTIVISIFIGAVICIQMQLNMTSPIMPAYATGLATRDILLLEFSSAVLCLILSGKVGSNIASEIGTMRVTEQIDALEIMGINSAQFLVLPKILAFAFFIPILVIFSIATGLFGGWIIATFTDMIPVSRYIYGIQTMFIEWYVWYTIIKALVFSVIITSVASYFGYYVRGGALQVGKASTDAVVASSILILLFDVILTKLLMQ